MYNVISKITFYFIKIWQLVLQILHEIIVSNLFAIQGELFKSGDEKA